MTYLGVAYARGLGGLTKDETRAVKLFQQAAGAGDTNAMDALGVFYLNGLPGLVPQDEVRALKLYQQAADAGDACAMNYGSFCYGEAKGGLAKDQDRAFALYAKAATTMNAAGLFDVTYYGLNCFSKYHKPVLMFQNPAQRRDEP